MKFAVTLALLLAFVCAVIAQDLSVHPDQDQTTEDGTCSFTHYDLTTLDPPSLVVASSGFVSSIDQFTLTLRVSKRYLTAHANMSNAIGDFCSGSFAVVADGAAPCTVLLVATMSWGDAHSKCGVAQDLSAPGDHLVFRGSVLLDLTETNLPTIRTRQLSRVIHSVFPFLVRFPTTVSTSHTINTYFPVTVEAAIIRQFDVRTPAATTTAHSSIRLFTSVQFPFKLTAPLWNGAVFLHHSFNMLPVTETTAYLLSGEDCLDSSADAICEQEWLIEFDAALSPPVCDFSGTYTLNFTVRCENSVESTCPLPLVVADGVHEAPATIVMTITTEDFCPKTFADVPATATLSSFQDSALTIPKNDFLQGDVIHFQANSDSTKATITSTTVNTVTIDYGASSHVLLFDSAAPTSTYVTLISSAAKHCEFDVPLNAATFPVPLDGSVAFTFTVVLNLVFLNTQEVVRISQIFRPLDGASDSVTHPVDVAQTVTIATPSAVVAAPTSSSSIATNTLIYIVVGSCVGVILLATMAIVIRRRVVAAKKSTSTEMTGASSTVTGATTIV